MTASQFPQTPPTMSFPAAIAQCFRKYGDFSGRAGRREYWWWVLAVTIGWLILLLLAGATGILALLLPVYGLAILMPYLAATTRRLHDIGRTGRWQLAWAGVAMAAFFPIIVGLIVTIATFMGGVIELIIEVFLEAMITGQPAEDRFPWQLFTPLLVGMALASVIWVLDLIWAAEWLARKGQAGPNKYGADPRVELFNRAAMRSGSGTAH